METTATTTIGLNDTLKGLWSVPGNPEKRALFAGGGMLNFRSVSDLNRLIKAKLCSISGKYDLILGIPRSGLLAANLIALHLNTPLMSIEQVAEISLGRLRTSRRSLPMDLPKLDSRIRILVVDDSSNSGESIRRARKLVTNHESAKAWDVSFLAVYVSPESLTIVDHYLQVVHQPLIFEWNFIHHVHAQNFLFDLDGVLCEDGASESSDSMAEYVHHLENARPKIIPTLKVGAIVTSRLEKYRSQTEKWLKKHRVIYEHLIMTNLDTAEERRRLALHARFKADVYSTLGGSLFVESEAWQAKEIASITGKAVYNLEDNEFIAAGK